MVNDFRCLLANLTPTTVYAPGEVFVPPEYKPRELDRYEQVMREALFGRNPDRLMINFRCYQFLRVLHASKWNAAVLEYDTRLTYDAWTWPGERPDWIKVQVAIAPSPIHLTGQINPSDDEGIASDQYTIRTTGSGQADIFRKGTFLRSVTFTFGGGISSPITLGNSGIILNFATDPEINKEWSVSIPREPARSFGGIEDHISQTVDYGTISALINAGTDMQKITSRNLWYRGRDTQARLCGIIMALVNYSRSRS